MKVAMDGVVSLRSFDSDANQPPERVGGVTAGGKLLGAHAYSGAPETLATDLANDFASPDAEAVPEPIRKRMTPPDDQAAKRANATAQQWIGQLLKPQKDEPIGVIIIWREDTRLRPLMETGALRPIFVLIKGQAYAGGFLIKQLFFGDPLEATH
jgi:hypothetical protein